MCELKTSSKAVWLAVKVESAEFRPKIIVSESVRVKSQTFPEDHRHGELNDWLCIFHALCLHAGPGTSLCLYEVGTECRSSHVVRL